MRVGVAFEGWVRIDDRLIHGQVTVGWLQYLRYREIWVVDDVLREDPYVWDALCLAVPAGVEVRRMSVDEAIALVVDGSTASSTVLMLLRELEAVAALVAGGVSLARVNVGNLGAQPGSVRAFRNVSLTERDVAVLDALAGQGIEVFFQLAPEDARLGWEVVRRRLKRQ